MYTIRVNNRLPQAYKVCRTVPTSCQPTRNMATLLPRFVVNDFGPMFRLLDDYTSHVAPRGARSSGLRSFNPRFDVRETQEAYELHGELPGVDQENINIEFLDAQTLSIKGRTESHREQGTRPTPAVESQSTQPAIGETEDRASSEVSDTLASETSSYHKATVEDEVNTSSANPDATESTTAESTVETPAESTVSTKTTADVQPAQDQSDSSRFWVSERSIGTFQRSFAFAARVDQENVKASLKDGILSIVVPKATIPPSRRINIE